MTPARPSSRRWSLATGGSIVVLMLAVAIAEVSGWRFLRVPLQNALGSAIGVPVTLGPDVRLHLLWNPRLRADRLIAQADSGDGPAEKLVDTSGLLVRWSWPDLWRWKRHGALHLREFSAEYLDARYVRRADGSTNWPQDLAAGGMPSFGFLLVRDGAVEIADAVRDTQLVIHFKGREGTDRQASANAVYETTAKGRYRGLPVKLVATSGAALPLLGGDGSALAEQPMVALKVEASVGKAELQFEGEANDLLGSQLLSGHVKLRAGSLGRLGVALGMALPETAPFQLRGRLRHGVGVWRLGDVQLAVGHSRVGGDYRYDTRVDPPLLSGRLRASRIRLSDLGPAVGVPQDATVRHDDKVLPQREFDLPSLAAMDADLQANVDELDFGTSSLRPISDLRTHVILAKSVLRLVDLKARAGGGTVVGMSQLDGRKGAADWLAELRFSGLDVASWVAGLRKAAPAPGASGPSDAQNKPVDRPATAYLTGMLDAQMRVKGSGRSTAGILASLDGETQASIRDGSVSHLAIELLGIDAAQALGVAVRGDDALPLRCARFDLQLVNGVAVPRVAVFDNRDSTVRIDGKVDLRDERLALRATTKPKDFTFVALRAPVLITGTLGAPRVEVEPGPVLARAAASVALGVVATPAAALLPLIDPGAEEEGDPCANTQSAASDAQASSVKKADAARQGTAARP